MNRLAFVEPKPAQRSLLSVPFTLILALAPLACTEPAEQTSSVSTAPTTTESAATESETGDGDGDTAGDGDGDEEGCVGVVPLANEPPGDGDGDVGDGDGDGPGDGDGDATGDGDGDATGDGDGDATGDGDGDSPGDGDGDATGDGDGDPEPPCDNCAPYWRLYDFQPQSCGYEQYYGLDSFEGHVTMIAMLAGWCSYCQGQAQRMDQLRLELKGEGYEVQMTAINAISADNEEDRQNLVDRCSFPLFQDTDMQDAWGAHVGGKDDIYIYAADGTLAAELPVNGDLSTNLGTEEGYMNVKQALIDAFE